MFNKNNKAALFDLRKVALKSILLLSVACSIEITKLFLLSLTHAID